MIEPVSLKLEIEIEIMAKKKAIAKKQTSALSDERPDYAGDSQRGNEQVGANELTIPRLSLIQDLSPQRKKSNDEYIDGAEEGDMFNTVSNALYKDDVTFIPVYMKKEWVIWKDRDEGGGFRGAYDSEAAAKNEMRELDDGDQCEIVDTHQQFGMLLHEDGSLEQIVLSMSKSQMTPSRQLNSQIQLSGADRWAKAYRVGTKVVNGPKGEYFNFRIDPLGWVNEETYAEGEKMYEAIAAGEIGVDRGSEEEVDRGDM